MDRGAWRAAVCGVVKESIMTQQLNKKNSAFTVSATEGIIYGVVNEWSLSGVPLNALPVLSNPYTHPIEWGFDQAPFMG